jgi:hypothetical protein
MGIFDGISVGDKKRLLDIEISRSQLGLYSLLLQLDIDPEEFDDSSWNEPLNMDTPIGRVRHYIDLIKSLKAKKAETE